jgi:hemoglobin-like flavoprotein
MADKSMQLVIGVDIKDVNAAINKTKALESQVKRIVDAHRSGKIDIEKYNKGLLQTKRAYDSISPSSQNGHMILSAQAHKKLQQKSVNLLKSLI